MKSYTITVNGNVYDITVEENGAAPAAPAAPRKATPAPKAPAAAPKAAGAGSIKVEAGAAGKVFKVEASVGQKVSKGDTVIIDVYKRQVIGSVTYFLKDFQIQRYPVIVTETIKEKTFLWYLKKIFELYTLK